AAVFSVVLDTSQPNIGIGTFPLSEGVTGNGSEKPTMDASAAVILDDTNNDLTVTAVNRGDDFNGVVSIINSGKAKKKKDVYVTWNAADRLLVIDVNAASTAQDIVNAMDTSNALVGAFATANNADAIADFRIALRTPDSGVANDGSRPLAIEKQGLVTGTGT